MMTEIETKPAIGEKLRTVRAEQQMSLRDLAHKAEISASMLSQIETGKAYPSVRSIYSIAAALGVPVDYFFPDQGSNHAAFRKPEPSAAGEMTASDMREANMNHAAKENTAGFAARAGSPTPVVHAGARPTIELKGGVTWSRLTALAEPGAEFLEILYTPGAMSGTNMSHHEGREFGLILEGELSVELGFETYILHPGDTIIFDSTTPHRLINNSAQPTRAIWVVFEQG
jgi:transcriptional regulator with XRE-family HTH domain/quercetin dioxygenase-like cupin family protein